MTSEFVLSTDEVRDPTLWIGVPTFWPVPGHEDTFPDVETWASLVSGAVWDDSGLEKTAGRADTLKRTLAHVADTYPAAYPGCLIFLHLPGPMDMPLSLAVGELDASDLTPSEAEATVREISWTEDPDAVEAPLVEEFTSQHLGTGIRVTRYLTNSGDGTINVSVRYGWYVPEMQRQVHAFAFALDPAHMLSALDDIDVLCRGMRFVAK